MHGSKPKDSPRLPLARQCGLCASWQGTEPDMLGVMLCGFCRRKWGDASASLPPTSKAWGTFRNSPRADADVQCVCCGWSRGIRPKDGTSPKYGMCATCGDVVLSGRRLLENPHRPHVIEWVRLPDPLSFADMEKRLFVPADEAESAMLHGHLRSRRVADVKAWFDAGHPHHDPKAKPRFEPDDYTPPEILPEVKLEFFGECTTRCIAWYEIQQLDHPEKVRLWREAWKPLPPLPPRDEWWKFEREEPIDLDAEAGTAEAEEVYEWDKLTIYPGWRSMRYGNLATEEPDRMRGEWYGWLERTTPSRWSRVAAALAEYLNPQEARKQCRRQILRDIKRELEDMEIPVAKRDRIYRQVRTELDKYLNSPAYLQGYRYARIDRTHPLHKAVADVVALSAGGKNPGTLPPGFLGPWHRLVDESLKAPQVRVVGEMTKVVLNVPTRGPQQHGVIIESVEKLLAFIDAQESARPPIRPRQRKRKTKVELAVDLAEIARGHLDDDASPAEMFKFLTDRYPDKVKGWKAETFARYLRDGEKRMGSDD